MEIVMIVGTLGILALLGMGYAAWKQIPPEDPEIIAARKFYGKAK